MSDLTPFHAPISEEIWGKKYRYLDKFTGEIFDQTVEDTWRRIAEALAEVETSVPNHVKGADAVDAQTYWAQEFYDALSGFQFIPAGRIIAGAGTGRRVTLFNCYVMGTIPDSMDGIFKALREAALTMQQGGGIGYDFSTLRPKGAQVKQVAADASGPLTFMDVWDAMCRTVMSAGSRRGAMMATMRCDHPDIEDYIVAKQDPARLRMFNMSVLVTDKFMAAVEADDDWDLVFKGKVYKTIKAVDLWNQIMESTYAYAEPGVIFIDRINDDNNLKYMETISSTNPCGEQPLPPYGACLLGSINLAALVENPYQSNAGIDSHRLKRLVSVAVRMMDNVNDVSLFPLEEQLAEAKAKRRIGLGITGLADALLMCGIRYGSDEAAQRAEKWMQIIALEAYRASIMLAKEKGPFPALDRAQYLNSGQFADRQLPGAMKQEIMEHGIRNSHLLSIAPTGTISLYAGNISSGVEPIFAPSYMRKTLQDDGSKKEQRVVDYAVAQWEKAHDDISDDPLPPAYVDAQTLAPLDHIKMQSAVQKWIDTSISKTVNCPEDISFEDFKDVYITSFKLGCKGCTTYRPNDVTGSVIEVEKPVDKPVEQELTPLTDELIFEEARNFMARHGKDALKAKLDRMDVKKVKDLTGADRIDDAHKLYWWMIHYGQPQPVESLPPIHPEGFDEHLKEKLSLPPEKPTDRPLDLPGQTYKVKLGGDPAFYVTVSDIEENGQRRPFEVFIAAKNPEHMQWTNALALMVSAVFRRPHDASFVVEELKSVFDPKGGGWWQGKYWNSTVAAIGRVIEIHMIRIGYINDPNVPHELTKTPHTGGTVQMKVQPLVGAGGPEFATNRIETCQKCHSANLKNEGGCPTCLDCGHSKCG